MYGITGTSLLQMKHCKQYLHLSSTKCKITSIVVSWYPSGSKRVLGGPLPYMYIRVIVVALYFHNSDEEVLKKCFSP